MKILVIGATGFIGRAIYESLLKDGLEVVAGTRNPHKFDGDAIRIDFVNLDKNEQLVRKLKGFDIIINAVGIITPKGNQTFEQMHTIAPVAIFNAAKKS